MKNYRLLLLTSLFVFTSCHNVSPKKSERRISSLDELPRLMGRRYIPELEEQRKQDIQDAGCAQQICGPSGSNVSYNDTLVEQNTRKNYLPGQPIYQRIDRALKASAMEILKSGSSEVGAINYLRAHPEYQIPLLWKEVFNRIYYVQVYMLAAMIKGGEDIMYGAPLPQLQDSDFDRIRISAQDKAWIKKVHNSGADQGIVKAIEDYYRYNNFASARIFSSDIYPHLPSAQALQRLVRDCQNKIKRFNRDLGTHLFGTGLPICSGKTNYFDERTLGPEISSTALLNFWIPTTTTPVFLEREWNWHKDVLKYMNTQEYRIRNRMYMVPITQMMPQVNEVVAECHKIIGPAVEMSPDTVKLRLAEDALNSIRAATKKIINIQDPRLKNQFERGLNRTGFSFPPTQAQLVNNILQRFNLDVSDSRHSSEVLANPANPEFAFNLLQIMEIRTMNDGAEDTLRSFTGMILSSLKDACGIYASDSFSDFMYTINGESFISWSSVKHLNVGYGVIAHELGHRVAELLQQIGRQEKGSYYLGMPEAIPLWEKRACTNILHGTTQDKYPNGENFKTEEDWADMFAAEVVKMNRAQYPWVKNFGCALMDEKTDKPGYVVDYKELDYDTHSSGIFRTIYFEKALNGLSSACTNSLKRKNNLPSCFYNQ